MNIIKNPSLEQALRSPSIRYRYSKPSHKAMAGQEGGTGSRRISWSGAQVAKGPVLPLRASSRFERLSSEEAGSFSGLWV